MGTPVAIVLAGLLIAAAIAVTGRYHITQAQYEARIPTIWRLDTWTGNVQWCSLDTSSLEGGFSGARMACEKEKAK